MFSTSTASALYLLATTALLAPALADSAIFTETDAIGTFYYDISETSTSTTEACGSSSGDPVVAGWATASNINSGVPYCEKSRGKSLAELGTNAIVAFNSELVAADPAKWCGREVNIYDADGTKFDYTGGQLFIWDGCAACSDTDSQKIDLSAPAFVELKGGTCAGTNPSGFTYEVLDTYFWDPSVGLGSSYTEEGGSLASSTASSSSSSAGSPSTATTSSAAAQTSTSAAASQAVSTSTQISRTIRYSTSKTTQLVESSSVGIKILAADVTGVETASTTAAIETETETATSTSSAAEAAETASSSDDCADATDATDASDGATTSSLIAIATDFVSASTSASVSASDETSDVSATATSSATASITSSTSSSSTTSTSSTNTGCTYGAWQCSGLSLQVCNYPSWIGKRSSRALRPVR